MSERPLRHELHAYCVPCDRRVGRRENVDYALTTDPDGEHCDECGAVLVIRFERCLGGERRTYWRHKKTRRWFGRNVWLPVRADLAEGEQP